MKVGHAVRCVDLGLHPNDDAEKAAQFSHVKSLRYSGLRRNAERDAMVNAVHVTAGDRVAAKDLLIELE